MSELPTHSLIRVRVPRFKVETDPVRLPSEMILSDAIFHTRPMTSEHKTSDLLQLIQTAGLKHDDCVEKDELVNRANAALLTAVSRVQNSTFHPVEDLRVPECMEQSISSLGLFPSGSVTLLFEDDDSSFTDSVEGGWSINVKPVKFPGDVFKIRFLRPLDMVHTLKSRIAVQRRETLSPADALTLVASGRILASESTLVGSDLRDGATVICLRREEAAVTPPSPATLSQNAPDPDLPAGSASSDLPHGNETASAPPLGSQSAARSLTERDERRRGVEHGDDARAQGRPEGGEEEEEEEAALCRICHGGEEHGPMLSPCRCTGSMRFVHLSCLNTWRRVAPSERSFTQCDQCGYAYRFERNRTAAFLLSDRGGLALAIVTCLALLYGGAWAVELLLPSDWRQLLFRRYLWRPRLPAILFMGNRPLFLASWFPRAFAASQRHVDFLSGGAYVFASIGFADFVQQEVAFWRNHRHVLGWANPHTLMLFAWFVSVNSSGSLGRVVVVIGFLASSRLVVLAAHRKAVELAQSLGERMLEVAP